MLRIPFSVISGVRTRIATTVTPQINIHRNMEIVSLTLNFPQNLVGKLLIDNRDNKQKKKITGWSRSRGV
jgi:hypothetical protein